MSKTHFEIACRSYPGMTVLWQRTFSIMMFDQTHCMYQYSKTRLYCDSKKTQLSEVCLHRCQKIIQIEN